MLVIHRKTRKALKAEIKNLTENDLKFIQHKKRFSFDWRLEKAYDCFKLVIKDTNNILGLMSLIDYPNELRIEIHLIELSKEHKGKDKKIGRIAGCLIAYACRIAFSKGYDGFVSLVPKTTLIKHYQETYGFQKLGRQMALSEESSKKLIDKYL